MRYSKNFCNEFVEINGATVILWCEVYISGGLKLFHGVKDG